MLSRFKRLLAPVGESPLPNLPRLAVAALLIEAARMDQDFAATERQAIEKALGAWFDIGRGEAHALLAEADAAVANSHDLVRHTRLIKENYSHDDRVALIELLWDVVLADGRVDDYEANLIRRVAGLIYVSDQESGAARKRVLERQG